MNRHEEVSMHPPDLSRSETMEFRGEQRPKCVNKLNKIDKTALIFALFSLSLLFKVLPKVRCSGTSPKRSYLLSLIEFISSVGGIVNNFSV